MTRINIVPVEKLYDQHLLAEHREIKRIPNVIKQGKYSLKWKPKNYTMGTWHVKFFYNKLKWLHERYNLLHSECLKRGFKVQDYTESFLNLPSELYLPYTPTKEDLEISKKRLDEKYRPNFYKFYSVTI